MTPILNTPAFPAADVSTPSRRLAFIDWMKALAMFVIVFGHTANGPIQFATTPIFVKQLGVVLFVFTLGYSLSRETRPRWQVAYNRLFDMLVLGGIFALLGSLQAYLQFGSFSASKLALSNYQPLLLGVNVFLDQFPANPTTWFIGTYIHLVLLHCLLLRGIKIHPWMLAAAVLVEVLVRSVVMASAGSMIAYMVLPNWLTVFLLGIFAAQRNKQEAKVSGLSLWVPLTLAMILLWPWAMNQVPARDLFPWMTLNLGSRAASLLATSAAISTLYVTHAWLWFEVTRRLPSLAAVRLIARNTLIIFIAHMPLFYLVGPHMERWFPSPVGGGWPWPRYFVGMLIYFVGLALASEVLLKVLSLKALREQLWNRLTASKPAPVHQHSSSAA